MRRAWVDSEELSGAVVGERFALPKEASHHLERVLRLSADTEVELFDGAGGTARGRLTGDGGVRIDETGRAEAPLRPVVIAQALVRGAKLDEVVRRGTELGVARVLVFEAERSQPGGRLKPERLERIAREAARQAERAHVPAVEGPTSFSALLDEVRAFDGVAALGVLGAPKPLSEALKSRDDGGLLVVIGPEGGLTADEQERLAAAGAVPVALGAHVLRTETAGLAAAAAAQVVWGRL